MNIVCHRAKGGFAIMDLVFIGLTAVFFALCWGLIKVCEKV
jgi:hypothetical protein